MRKKNSWPRFWPMALYGLLICLLAAFVIKGFLGVKEPEAEEDVSSLFERIIFEADLPDIDYKRQPGPGYILDAYRDPETKMLVEDFFEKLCGSRMLALVILDYSSEYNIAPALAFSLCWEESRYKTNAVNGGNINLSVDRGLFQLNNNSFPQLKEHDFFDPVTNTKYGLAHLRWCLDTAGTEVSGLAMYNAGPGRVGAGGTPKATLDYVSRILNRQRQTEEIFLTWFRGFVQLTAITEEIKAKIEIIPAVKPVPERRFTLSLLTPLGRQ